MRSLLFVPADDAKRIERVHERGADVVILDLEDGVAPESKGVARAALSEAAARIVAHGAKVFVRVNTDWRDDLAVALTPALSGVVFPKLNNAATARDAVAAVGARAAVIVLIESAEGLFNAPAIAAVEGVSGLALGGEDLCVELGVAPSEDALDLPCKLIALAAATRGLAAIGAPVSISEFKDLDAYRQAIGKARRIGLTGALCIHPAQVAIANSGFMPTDAEVEHARAIVETWERRGAEGVIVVDGRMVDAPVVARAQRVIAQTGG
jgi:citrate lyase subunit beta/citryl-CoA lyase